MKFIELFLGQEFILTKMLFQRALALVYFIGFLILFNQARPLFGSEGITPAKLFIDRINFWQSPSVFFFNNSDSSLMICSLVGLVVSALAFFGITEKFGYVISISSWALMWVLYLSFVNIGQTWYGYGWESMLLETGFLAIFLGPANVAPPAVIIWAIRWVCFRNMFGAGLIKLRGDQCWRDLTCMYVFYETQPVPNPLSYYFHQLPKVIHRMSVIFTYVAELFAPLLIFIPLGWPAAIGGIIMILFQSIIIVSGNLSWLNYLSIVLCIPCFNDDILKSVLKLSPVEQLTTPLAHNIAAYILGAFILWRSYWPIMNMISTRQSMNRGYDPFHLVNTYGAFGSVTKERNELVVMGTMDKDPGNASWKIYEFKGKPTDTNRMPSLMSPYHWRLDWQMWFAGFGNYRYAPWTLNFVHKLLIAQKDVLSLLAHDPFKGQKPKWIKVDYYNYKFQDPGKKGWWKRKYLGEWLPPLNMQHDQFRKILIDNKWLRP